MEKKKIDEAENSLKEYNDLVPVRKQRMLAKSKNPMPMVTKERPSRQHLVSI